MKFASFFKLAFASAAACSALTLTHAARANGRYPQAGQIVVDPDDPQHIVVRATYGVMFTTDGGKQWGWVCEPSIGYMGNEDPMMGMAHGGNTLAAIFEGLSISNDNGCDWSFYEPLKSKYVIDLAVDKVTPSNAVLIVTNSVGNNTFLTQLWQSMDGGSSWKQAGVNLPTDFVGLTVDSAPSMPNTIYVSGRLGPPKFPGAVEKSVDRGQTWQKVLVPGSDNTHLPYIGGIDPNYPNTVYLRLVSDHADSLVVTHDGGTTWKTAYQAVGQLYGFALSPDGSKVAIGGDMDGLRVASTTDLQFEKVSKIGPYCLTWTTVGLYACANEAIDHFEAGISTDDGKTFTSIYHMADLCGPPACPGGSDTAKKCSGIFGPIASQIGSECGMGGGGMGGASSSAAATTTHATTTSAAAGGDGGSTGEGSSGSCECGLDGRTSGATAIPWLAVVGLAARARSRRRKDSRC